MGQAGTSGWDEARIHRWLAERLPGTQLAGVASQDAGLRRHVHDAAVLPEAGEGLDALCCDRCEQGVHFDRSATPEQVGAKAAGRSLSDLAATAARPRALLLALAAPRELDEAWLLACLEGVIRMGDAHGAPLVGGDLSARPGPISLVVSALGRAPEDPPGRDRARPGDEVLVTGPVGGSIRGRHLDLTPRVAAGRGLHAAGVRAMMDVSDGLALDLDRMARLSGVTILLEQVPIHTDAAALAASTGRSALDHALHDGEDHELLACAAPAVLARFLASPEAGAAVRIGRVVAATADRPEGLLLPDPAGGAPLPFDPHDPRAFIHGR